MDEPVKINHVGWSVGQTQGYLEAHKDGLEPLSLREMASLHLRDPEAWAARAQARLTRLGLPDTAENRSSMVQQMMQLTYPLSYSFIYYCLEGPGKAAHRAHLEAWRAWQWSAPAVSAAGAAAWRQFRKIFGDTTTLERDWLSWLHGLDPNSFTDRSPQGTR